MRAKEVSSRKIRVGEAAAYLGVSKSWLDKIRLEGDGPRFSKLGYRVVVYDLGDLDEWVASKKRRHTSE